MRWLIFFTLLPLAVIGVQIGADLDRVLGVAGYSLYKVFFLVPPLLYCRWKGLSVRRDVLKVQNWRNYLLTAIGLGVLAIGIFWSAYYAWGDLLLDKAMIVGKIADQFSVTAATVLLIAPVTIFLNSLLEEFFYRGFTFGQLVKRNRAVAYVLPAVAFTAQHLLFIYHWLSPLPLALAIVGLMVFALALQKLYASADSIVAPWVVHILGDVAMMGIAVSLLWK